MISVIWNSDSVIDGRISAFRPLFVSEAGRPPAERHGLAAAERRQPAEDHREHEDQQDADQERRQAHADERAGEQQLREPRVAPERRVDAERDADDEREERRRDRQLERGRQALLEQRRTRAGPGAARSRSRRARHCRRSARTAPGTTGRARAPLRSLAFSATVASCPTMNATGSPVKLKRPNAMNATTAITATDCRMRRRMKADKSAGPRRRNPGGPRARAGRLRARR